MWQKQGVEGSEPLATALPERLDGPAADRLRGTVLRARAGTAISIDAHALQALDSVAAARLLRIVAEARRRDITVRLRNLPDTLRPVLAEIDPGVLETPTTPARHPVETVGEHAFAAVDAAAGVGRLVLDTASGLSVPFGRRGIKWTRTVQQMVLVGSTAVPIVSFISLLIGVVLSLNGAQQLRQFGAAIFIANLVAISMTREMGPLLTAVIVSGRTGSAIAAEIGTMVISQEIDALQTMAISPIRFLVVPKVVALVTMLPLLTVVSDVAGILGGYLVGVFGLDLGSDPYLTQTVQSLLISDVLTGLIKSVVFALIIAFVGAYKGFTVHGGPEAIGRATTSAVVTAIILSIVANAIFTAFFYVTG